MKGRVATNGRIKLPCRDSDQPKRYHLLAQIFGHPAGSRLFARLRFDLDAFFPARIPLWRSVRKRRGGGGAGKRG